MGKKSRLELVEDKNMLEDRLSKLLSGGFLSRELSDFFEKDLKKLSDEAAAKAGPYGRIVAPPTFALMAAPLRRNEAMHSKGYASPEEARKAYYRLLATLAGEGHEEQ